MAETFRNTARHAHGTKTILLGCPCRRVNGSTAFVPFVRERFVVWCCIASSQKRSGPPAYFIAALIEFASVSWNLSSFAFVRGSFSIE